MGEKPFRAGQIFKWLHEGVESFEEMSNLSKDLRARLAETFLLTVPEVARKQVSRVDGTVKYFMASAGRQLRGVRTDALRARRVRLRFDAGRLPNGLQVLCVGTQRTHAQSVRRRDSGRNPVHAEGAAKKVSNIVLMGTGEPLDNYDNVLKFLHLVSCPEGINIGQRHISLSTSGIADRIEMLAREKLQITLSVSLHAPDDETRSSIMPVNDAYPVERLMKACRYYFDTTGRRISYEYMMARDKTDRPWQADLLAKLLKGRPAHVNLIPLNEVAESPLKPSRPETVRRFQQALEKRGVTATVRRKLGPDIDAACGQLRQRQLKEDGKSSSRD